MPTKTPEMPFHNYALSSSLVNKNLFDSIANSGNTPLQGEIRIPLALQQQHLQNFWGRWRNTDPESKQGVEAKTAAEGEDTEWEKEEDFWGVAKREK